MIDILFGAVLLVLAASCALLFAMLGELNSRFPTERGTDRVRELRPLEEARLGVEPNAWPEPLAGIPSDPDPAVVLVLSTACSTCDDVAGQLSAELDRGETSDWSVVVSTQNGDRGDAFIDQHGLERLRHYVDTQGSWISSEFDVKTSPTALLFRSGRLESALIFQDVETLKSGIGEPEGVA